MMTTTTSNRTLVCPSLLINLTEIWILICVIDDSNLVGHSVNSMTGPSPLWQLWLFWFTDCTWALIGLWWKRWWNSLIGWIRSIFDLHLVKQLLYDHFTTCRLCLGAWPTKNVLHWVTCCCLVVLIVIIVTHDIVSLEIADPALWLSPIEPLLYGFAMIICLVLRFMAMCDTANSSGPLELFAYQCVSGDYNMFECCTQWCGGTGPVLY